MENKNNTTILDNQEIRRVDLSELVEMEEVLCVRCDCDCKC